MEEIKVGEYVRTRDGEIGIITETYPRLKWRKRKASINLEFNLIKKHSPNMINLIEEGDYVNGKLIHHKFGNPKNGELMILYGNGKHFDNKNIKSIVTREMMKSVEYRVV